MKRRYYLFLFLLIVTAFICGRFIFDEQEGINWTPQQDDNLTSKLPSAAPIIVSNDSDSMQTIPDIVDSTSLPYTSLQSEQQRVTAPGSANDRPSDHIKSQEEIMKEFDQVSAQYTQLAQLPSNDEKPDEVLQMDMAVRHFVSDYNRFIGKDGQTDSAIILNPNAKQLGLWLNPISKELEYDGNFLRWLRHKTDRTKGYEQYTLYHEVMRTRENTKYRRAPDLDMADEYLDKFPDGPFAADIHLYLAQLFADIYREMSDAKSTSLKGYIIAGDSCFYPSDFSEPYASFDRASVRKAAIEHLQSFVRLNTGHANEEYVQSTLTALAKEEQLKIERRFCRVQQMLRKKAITIYTQFHAIKEESVEAYLEIDTKMRELVTLFDTISEFTEPVNLRLGKSMNESLGISYDHYNDLLQYDGRFLRKAHTINPNSSERAYTLYSTVFKSTESDAYVNEPQIGNANQYLKEFPDGPFSFDVHFYLATFYNDLFYNLSVMIIYKEPLESFFDPDIYCLSRDVLTDEPIEVQRERARKNAKYHFNIMKNKFPKQTFSIYYVDEFLENLELDDPHHVSSYFCPD